MFERREDQAAGLRELFARRDVRVLPLVGHVDQAPFVVNLAAALSMIGRRTLVLDGERGCVAPTVGLRARWDLSHLLAGDLSFRDVAMRSREGFWVMPAARGLATLARAGADAEDLFSGFSRLDEPFDTVLACAAPETLAPLLARRGEETALVCGTSVHDIAQAYAQIKAMRIGHGLSRFRVIFSRAPSLADATAAHQRLADTVERFLGAELAFGGAIESQGALSKAERARASVFSVAADSQAARAFERLAASCLDWPLPVFGTTEAAGLLH